MRLSLNRRRMVGAAVESVKWPRVTTREKSASIEEQCDSLFKLGRRGDKKG